MKQDEKGNEIQEYHKQEIKTRTGGTRTRLHAFCSKQCAVPKDPSSCPITAYKTYHDHGPTYMMIPDIPFYIAIKHKPGSSIWYKKQPLGVFCTV